MTRLVLLGPPGAGKGTQAAALSRAVGVPAISTGDVFRANVQARTPLGLQAAQYMDAGDLVPDSLTVSLIVQELSAPPARSGFLLDGFPRNVAQADELASILADGGQRIDCALDLQVPRSLLIQRLSTRRTLIDGSWVTRTDDDPAIVTRRLAVHEEATAPLTAWFADRSTLCAVDGTGTVDEVTERLLAAARTRTAPTAE